MVKIISFNDIDRYPYLRSKQGKHLIDTLNRLGAIDVVIEEKYRDKHYMIDFSKFHSRSFPPPEITTTRLHFFRKIEFSDKDFTKFFEKALKTGDKKNVDKLTKNYIGFIVSKPITNSDGYKILGRTIINPFQSGVKTKNPHYITTDKNASLYGIPLGIEGLPYQSQDNMVCACATVAIWTALHSLNKYFDVPISSPCEITERAVTTPSIFRSFPSSSLSLEQIIYYIKSLGLDAELIILSGQTPQEANSMIENAVKAYLHCDLPIIASLTLRKNQNVVGHHAVIISGYKCNSSGKIIELYVHDDQIGPYTKTKAIGTLAKWKNEWIDEYGYSGLSVDELVIPVYPKIRLTFSRIYKIYKAQSISSQPFKLDLFLTQIKKYKSNLLNENIRNKKEILIKEMPRFLWIIRVSYLNKIYCDMLYDGTSVFKKKLFDVDYI